MSKKRFIQAVIARSLPAENKRDAALAYAEDLWGWLTLKGFGDDRPADPRDGKDWYEELKGQQRRYFDAFWLAFAHKKGRSNAARRWYQLGALTPDEYQQIIDAAAKEANRALAPGQVRKMAEGWLFEKRWLDFAPVKTHATSAANLAINGLVNQLAGIRKLYEQSGDEKLRPQIEKLEKTIADAKGGNHETVR